jgi:hypothetical protein
MNMCRIPVKTLSGTIYVFIDKKYNLGDPLLDK